MTIDITFMTYSISMIWLTGPNLTNTSYGVILSASFLGLNASYPESW